MQPVASQAPDPCVLICNVLVDTAARVCCFLYRAAVKSKDSSPCQQAVGESSASACLFPAMTNVQYIYIYIYIYIYNKLLGLGPHGYSMADVWA